MNNLFVPTTCKTTTGYTVERIEKRGNTEIKLSGIIYDSSKPYNDSYVSWDLDGKNPSIETFGNLIL